MLTALKIVKISRTVPNPIWNTAAVLLRRSRFVRESQYFPVARFKTAARKKITGKRNMYLSVSRNEMTDMTTTAIPLFFLKKEMI